MALTTIYSPEGVAVDVEPVDAREYIEHGGYTREPPVLTEDSEVNKGIEEDAGNKKPGRSKAGQ